MLAKLATLLDDEERRRAAGHRSAVQRARFVAAHGATRRIVAAHLGLDPGGFTWRRGEHGKPEPDIGVTAGRRGAKSGTNTGLGSSVDTGARISISTSSQIALVAVAQPGSVADGSSATPREIGIDIERLVSDHEATRLANRFFPPDQAAYIAAAGEGGGRADRFATLWCRKEACVKALGGRLVQGLGLAVQGAAPLLARFPIEHGRDGERDERDVYRVSDVPAPKFFRAAVALAGAAPYRLRCHLWSAEATLPSPHDAPVHD